ncbi:MAG: thioredoxin fold domain-containing protein [Acidiferrobacter sp.]
MIAALVFLVGAQVAHANLSKGPLWTFLRHTESIHQGVGPARFYVFFDPNCPYCHKLYETLQPLILSAGLAVRWVPVGILALSSYGKAAALLEATDPALALARMEQGFRNGRGALRPARATPRVARALLYNVRLFEASGAQGVPFLVFRTPAGDIRTIEGDPPDAALARIVADITGPSRSKPQTAGP